LIVADLCFGFIHDFFSTLKWTIFRYQIIWGISTYYGLSYQFFPEFSLSLKLWKINFKMCLHFFYFFNLHQWMWGVVYFQARTENGQGPNPIFWFDWIHDFNKEIVIKHANKNDNSLKVNKSKPKMIKLKINTRVPKISQLTYR
jgi:hypothetical protein